jgi:DNA-binding response OmpR family regulator
MLLEGAIKEQSHLLKAREIFFIDDDKEELGIFNLAIKRIDVPINLTYARSADDLFKLLENFTPDLLFLDLHLPGKSGITCLKMLRHNKKYDSLPIIIYSKLGTDVLIDDCYQARANFYLIKPVSIKGLSVAINKVIETKWDSEAVIDRDSFIISQ